MTKAQLEAAIAEETRREIMFDLKEGCGTCHWASSRLVELVRQYEKIVREEWRQSQEKRVTE